MDANAPSHYAILGLAKSEFSPERLRKQYRALALKWHPDRNRGEEQVAAERFKEIQEAFSTLSDPKVRAAYDLELVRRHRAAAMAAGAAYSAARAHTPRAEPARCSRSQRGEASSSRCARPSSSGGRSSGSGRAIEPGRACAANLIRSFALFS